MGGIDVLQPHPSNGVADEVRGFVDVELVRRLLPVFFNRFYIDAKGRGDLPVAQTFRNESEHLRLACGEVNAVGLE